MAAISDEADIIQALIAAATGVSTAAGADLWPGFLSLLGGHLRAGSAVLHLEPETGSPQHWQQGAIALPDAMAWRQMRFDRVYSHEDLPGLDDRRQPLRALKCAAGAGFALLAVQRGGQDFRAVDAARLSGLPPYLGQALTTWQALRQERARRALDGQVGAALGGGWMTLSPAGVVTGLAPQTRDWLRTATALRLRPNGRLDFRDEDAAQQFRQALTEAANGGPSGPVFLAGPPVAEMVIRITEVAGEAVLLGLIRHMRPAQALAPERVAAAYDLSRSEARLAILICDGASLTEAATALGWTLETTRSCSKQIYARMGVSGQAAVQRRMLTGALWLS